MHVEWALESNANSTTIISLSRKWNLFSTHGKVWPDNACPVTVINLLAARERGSELTQVVKPLELDFFLTGMEQPLAESPTRDERELQASCPYGTPLVDLRHMLEGDVPQDKMTCLFL